MAAAAARLGVVCLYEQDVKKVTRQGQEIRVETQNIDGLQTLHFD